MVLSDMVFRDPVVRLLVQIFLQLVLLVVDMVELMMKMEHLVVLVVVLAVVPGVVLEEPRHQVKDILVVLPLVLTHMETLHQAGAELVEPVLLPMVNGVLVAQV
jgi:hypothetical protein